MTDGIDHINIYSKGATDLGRALSNFSAYEVCTVDGEFASIEGYWYWLGSDHIRREELRLLTGWEAKKVGRELRGDDWNGTSRFKMKIIHAMVSKLIWHPVILTKLTESTLPFRHYYVYDEKMVEPKDGRWIIDTWEHLRRISRN